MPTTLTIVYKPSKRQWYASFTVQVAETARTLYDEGEFYEFSNPRFTQKSEAQIRQTAKFQRRNRPPKKGVKASRRWRKINQRESQLKAKVARQRRDCQQT